ncbi:AraC family transcriptional regulator [Paenibacillus swuensis]|uniref:AraC family transcriptional regulator n=1 Tax=Paenibacillus swuensis TaxID=1178515 RepID=UPI0018D346F0|nr:helix-turn-helix domain-containing protein [Paenibacillus swuensis]
MSQSSYSAKAMMDSATNYALQMYSDPQFDKLLHYAKPKESDITYSLMRLNSYLNMNYFFYSIYMYSNNSQTFYMLPDSAASIYKRNAFFDTEAVKLLDNFKKYKRLAPIPRQIPVEVSGVNGKFANVYTFLFYDLPGSSDKLDNVIMLNISERWMKDTIKSLNKDGEGDTFIVDRQGNVVTGTERHAFMSNLSGESYMKNIAVSDEDTGYLVNPVDGVKSLIIYSKHEPSDWIFVRVLPYDHIMGNIDAMKHNVLLICFIILIIGLTVSMYLSKSLYKPIEGILSNLNVLAKEKRDNQFKLKQNYLSRLVHNLGDEKTQDIQERLREYAIEFSPNSEFIVMLMSIDGYEEFSNKYNYKDRSLLKYAIMNITTECLSTMGICECVDMEDRTITVIFNGNLKPLLEDQDQLDKAIRNIQDAVRNHLQLSLSVAVSEAGDSLAVIYDLYEEAQQLMERKFFEGYQSVIYSGQQDTDPSQSFMYPLQQEKSLIEVIKLGKADEAMEIIRDMSMALPNQSSLASNMFFNQLAYSICTTAISLEKSSGSTFNYDFHSFIPQLHKQETFKDVMRRFSELVEAICAGMKERKSSKHDHLIANIDDIIQQSYSDQDLSLFKIAETVDMSPAYLGRIFKKMTMKSVPDYLNEFRLEKAKELLSGTSLSIDEISQKTGYNNSTYFYKVFKKYNGITPNEYRLNINSHED